MSRSSVQSGGQVAQVPAGGTTTIAKGASRLVRVIVTAAGTGTGSVLFRDSTEATEGVVVGAIPATIGVGSPVLFDCPCTNGITVSGVAGGPGLAVTFDGY